MSETKKQSLQLIELVECEKLDQLHKALLTVSSTIMAKSRYEQRDGDAFYFYCLDMQFKILGELTRREEEKMKSSGSTKHKDKK